jgi:hypothetical protein
MENAPRPEIAAALVLEPFGIYTPTKELITFINKSIIEHRKTHGRIRSDSGMKANWNIWFTS